MMPESVQVIYDINGPGNPFHHSIHEPTHTALNRLAGLPMHDASLPTSAQPPLSILNSISAFFRPNSRQQPIPIRPNDTFGDKMTQITENTTRLYFINMNGITLEKHSVKFRDICEELRAADVHLFAAAEHNLDTNKFLIRQKLQDIARKSFEHFALQTATSSIPADKFYKPGGTLILAQGDVVGRIKEKGSDSLGRWSWIKLVGRNQRLITMISAYQVCVRPTNITGTTLPIINRKVFFAKKEQERQNHASSFIVILTNLCASAKLAKNPSFSLEISTNR
jgi:hypothetical protein